MKRARNPVSLPGILKGIPRGFDAQTDLGADQRDLAMQPPLPLLHRVRQQQGRRPSIRDLCPHRPVQGVGVIHADLIGGEPLLHPDIFPLMRHVVRSGMSTGMTTNGFLLSEDKLDALIDLGMAASRSRSIA